MYQQEQFLKSYMYISTNVQAIPDALMRGFSVVVLADVEDSENKVYGSLLVPKALLGADMEGSGLSNGGSLTEMNTTYARRIKRGQVAICSAMKTLINIFALAEGLGEKIVNNFEVRLTPIITVEDNRRDELLQNKIRNVSDMINLVQNIEAIDDTTKLNMIIEWLGSYLNQQDIVDIIDERLKELEDEEKTPDDLDDNEDTNTNIDRPMGGGAPSSPSLDINVNGPEENETETPEAEENETETETPELAPQVDLASIEGEDLI